MKKMVTRHAYKRSGTCGNSGDTRQWLAFALPETIELLHGLTK